MRQGAERWREAQRPEHGARRQPTVVSSVSLSAWPLLPKGDPPKGPTRNQGSGQGIISL